MSPLIQAFFSDLNLSSFSSIDIFVIICNNPNLFSFQLTYTHTHAHTLKKINKGIILGEANILKKS